MSDASVSRSAGLAFLFGIFALCITAGIQVRVAAPSPPIHIETMLRRYPAQWSLPKPTQPLPNVAMHMLGQAAQRT